MPCEKSPLRSHSFRETFAFRQGLWTEDLRIPPGQECSNGSLILLAVVLWRIFCLTSALEPAMKVLKTKTVRFAEIVEKCGSPEVYTLWQKPKTDRHFQSFIKNNRVMTILQSESGTDFGIVGFRDAKGARYLIFPKSLKRFIDRRVVGINWDTVRS